MIHLFPKLALSLCVAGLISIIMASASQFTPSYQLTANHPREGIQFVDIAHRLITNPVKVSSKIISFAWSPDGRYLITLQSVDNAKAVWVWDLQTHHWNNLTTLFGIYDLPSWSPDNQQITFTRNRHFDYGTELVVGDISTGETQLLLKDTPVARPVWSQDSQHIAFYSRNADLNWELGIVDKAGQRLHHIPFPDNPSRLPEIPPAWVTDQDQVIIQTQNYLYRVDVATETVSALYAGTSSADNLLHVQSHDGMWALVLPVASSQVSVTNLVDQTEICLFCTNALTRTTLYLESASWSPDDTFLVIPGAYATNSSIESPTLFIYNTQTSEINLLDAVLFSPLRWRPD
ncbi:MAG TPA: hypothetical protein VHL11_05510 [Phototrophicaceae bacterium]|jgi:Tol biopolymer transport system component|nr:hypothetical protein [Phototrophicaceae bacterium]